jgi:DNA-binding Lrp family transcriptional regulator
MIDKTDGRIINTLLNNSRLSGREIADKLDLSTATVVNRIRKLESKGIIRKHSAILDYGKLGYNIEALIDVIVKHGKEDLVMNKIAKNTNVFAVYDITGDFDITAIVRFQTREDLNKFLKELRSDEYVERTHTRLILNVVKEEGIRV